MKKITIVLSVVLCLIMLLTVCACTPNGFVSNSQRNSLYKEYNRPEAQMTLTLKKGSTDYKIEIVYSLLMDKTPVSVINFIKLVNSGAYENSIIDSYNSNYNYMVLGRYKYEEEKYFNNTDLAVSFAGEFESNGYSKPDGGYSEFSMFSLAMYHENTMDDSSFNSANGTLILATDTQTLNPANYAVFAELKSIKFFVNGVDQNVPSTKVNSDIYRLLTKISTTTKDTVYESKNSDISHSVSMLSTVVSVNVTMLGNTDWSKLPKVG